MGLKYQAVTWNRHKKIYDGVLLVGIALYLGLFIGLSSYFQPEINAPTLIIRSTGTLALLLLHLILVIGPLSRLDKRFLPILYNRRHLGVTMFLIALIHGGFSILQFHAFGDLNPIVSVIVSNTHYGNLMRFPFQSLGLLALIILFLMAASSHDFWLHNLGPVVWKGLHMMVYLAYAVIVLHVMLGVVQIEHSPWLLASLGCGMILVISVHVLSGVLILKQHKLGSEALKEGYVQAGNIDQIAENRAKLLTYEDQSIAIFKYENMLSAVNNECKHQHGPLSEGKIVDGCITCPWHGYQYIPKNGTSPPPFEEKIATYKVKLIGDQIWVDPRPNPPGTLVSPCQINLS
ncbi:MAG: hypothetical protein DHS20C17_26260 [Cyclobacteriaceae bacterium]|nr:MAG: hypothetical protein DHS20C17_26260 [Cyclobacteriaceae bacterium]